MKQEVFEPMDLIRKKLEAIPYPGFSRSIAQFKILDSIEIENGRLLVTVNVNMRSRTSYETLETDLKNVLDTFSSQFEYELTIKNESSFLDDEVSIQTREGKLQEDWNQKASIAQVSTVQKTFDRQSSVEDFAKKICRDEDELKVYKHYRNEWYRRATEFDPGPAPLAVCCELVSSCNLGCPMCYTVTEEFQSQTVGSTRIMPWPVAKAVIDECAEMGVYSMLFSWRGESTMYRARDEDGNVVNFASVLAYARKKGILEVTSLTNGGLITEEMAEQLIEAEPSWVSFSIDGLEKNYNKIRTPLNKLNDPNFNAFVRSTSNIILLDKLRKKHGTNRPQLRCNTIYPPISEDPMAYYDHMKGIGIDWVTVNELLDFRQDEIPNDEILNEWACSYPFQRLTVASNGTILPCTGAHDEYDDLILGRYVGTKAKRILQDGEKITKDYPETTLTEAWNSDRMIEIRELHKANRRCEIRTCKYCRHGAMKNGADWVPEDWDMEKMEWKGREWRE